MLALQLLGWARSALLVYSVLQTRILRLRVLNGVASAVLVVFNAAIAVWPMVAMNLVLTAINAFYVVRLVRRRHDVETFEVIKISPSAEYLKYLLEEFHADTQRFNPGFSLAEAARAEFGFLILRGAETVGLVLGRDLGDGSAQVDLDYVVPRYQGFTLGEFVYRSGGPLAALGYRRAVAPPRMKNAGDYWTNVGFRREGPDMVRDLTGGPAHTPLRKQRGRATNWVTTRRALPRPPWTVVDALAHFFLHVAAHRFDLIRQKLAAITGARPTGWVAPASDDDGEQPTPARLRKSRHVLGRMHGRDLRSNGSAPAEVRFVTAGGFEAWGQTEGLPGLNGRGTACTSRHPINARSPSLASPRSPWHGRRQGLESPTSI